MPTLKCSPRTPVSPWCPFLMPNSPKYIHLQSSIFYSPIVDPRKPLTTVCPLTLAAVATPVAFFRKQTEFRVGTVGENITQDAPTQPFVEAQESKHALKDVCTEFDISMYRPEAATISVAQSFRYLVPELVAVYVVLLTNGQPAVSTMIVEVAEAADDVALGWCLWRGVSLNNSYLRKSNHTWTSPSSPVHLQHLLRCHLR